MIETLLWTNAILAAVVFLLFSFILDILFRIIDRLLQERRGGDDDDS